MENKESPAIDIVKKYFSHGELSKEYKIYQSLTKANVINEAKAEGIIESTIKLSERINRGALRKEKYNLISEVKEKYNLEEFFKAKIHNYKIYASIYNLMEAHLTSEFIEPSFIIDNRTTLLEFLTKKEIDKEKIEDQVLKEYSQQDKTTRAFISKLLIDKFNTKYSSLLPEQKEILKIYINSISNTVSLKEYINKEFDSVKTSLNQLSESIKDVKTKIKLRELISIVKPLGKNEYVKDEDILNLLQFRELIHEVKNL